MSTITLFLAVGVRAPIEEGEYTVGLARIAVSYPATLEVGLPTPLDLPKSLSTLFIVSWDDQDGRIEKRLRSKSFVHTLPVHDAIEAINELLLAFKLVRLGELEGWGIRTVGVGDLLCRFSKIGDEFVGGLQVGLKMYRRYYPWRLQPESSLDDPFGTTRLAKPHIAANTYPVARRYVRCFELLEHGFYSEAFIVAFSILDDVTQQMLHRLLTEKGMTLAAEREELLRGIKERRLRLFLGPLLRVVSGQDLATLWPYSSEALDWLNKTRNRIAHGGENADYATAAKGIFACIKTLVVLWQSGLVDAEFTVEIFRHAKVTAAWTEDVPKWIPSGKAALSLDFDS